MLENSPPYANSSQALDAVIEIAEQAKVRNAAMLITGILVYNEATREVRAILEGPRDNVLKLLDCIRQDPRHHLDSAQDLSISDIDTRSFGQWNMSLISAVHQARRRGPFTQPGPEEPRSPSTPPCNLPPPPCNLPYLELNEEGGIDSRYNDEPPSCSAVEAQLHVARN